MRQGPCKGRLLFLFAGFSLFCCASSIAFFTRHPQVIVLAMVFGLFLLVLPPFLKSPVRIVVCFIVLVPVFSVAGFLPPVLDLNLGFNPNRIIKDIVLLVLFVLAVVHRLLKKKKSLPRLSVWFLWAGIYYVYTVIIFLTSVAGVASFAALRSYLLYPVAVTVTVVLVTRNWEDVRKLAAAYVVASCGIASLGLVQFYFADQLLMFGALGDRMLKTRMASVTGNPNLAAYTMVLGMFWALAVVQRRWLRFGVLALLFCGVLATGTRSAVLVLGLVFTGYCVVRRRWRALTVALVCAGVAFLFIGHTVSTRLLEAITTGDERLEMWDTVLEHAAFRGGVLFGLGVGTIGTFGELQASLGMGAVAPMGGELTYVDNHYVYVLVEQGVVGLGLWTAMNGLILWDAVRFRRPGFGDCRKDVLLDSCAMVVMGVLLICIWADCYNTFPINLGFWLAVGILWWSRMQGTGNRSASLAERVA
ncbi:O-antigen ligase family protein [Deferrisoma palaeochoriense]